MKASPHERARLQAPTDGPCRLNLAAVVCTDEPVCTATTDRASQGVWQ